MKKVIILFLLIALISLVFFRTQKPMQTGKGKLETITLGSNSLSVEVAQTIPEITLGLGQRDTLGSDGMLFVMPVRSAPTFWMKDMRFPLDFVWIDGNKVVDLTENVPAEPDIPDSQLHTYSPRALVTHVLELNAGEVRKRGIEIGNTVIF